MLALTLFGIFFAIALAGVPLLYSILITTTGIIALQGLGHPLETIFLSFIGGVERSAQAAARVSSSLI